MPPNEKTLHLRKCCARLTLDQRVHGYVSIMKGRGKREVLGTLKYPGHRGLDCGQLQLFSAHQSLPKPHSIPSFHIRDERLQMSNSVESSITISK